MGLSGAANVVDVAETYATARGFCEVDRAHLLRCLELHNTDPVFQILSGIISESVFSDPGRIVSEEAEKQKVKQQQQEAKQKLDDNQAERDTLSKHPLARSPAELKSSRGRRKKNQAQAKKDESEKMSTEEEDLVAYPPGEEEEDLYPDDVNESWARALPTLVKCSEAIGFAVATTQRTLVEMRAKRDELEGIKPPGVLEPFAESSDEDVCLHVLDPRTFRAFVRRDESYDAASWLIMIPLMVHSLQLGKTPEQARAEFMSGIATRSLEVKWYVLDPLSVYIYIPSVNNLPVLDGLRMSASVRSYVSRCAPERDFEIANRYAMAASNITNAKPVLPIIMKASNMPRKDGSGEGNTNEDAREVVPQSLIDNEDLTPGSREAPGMIGEYRIQNNANDNAREDQDEQRRDDMISEKLAHAYSIMEQPLGAVGPTPTRRATWQLPEGREIGVLPPATAPVFYVEQAMKRWREAAAMFGIPVGVLLNYSIMDGSSEAGTMGGASSGGDKGSGLGGATSGTTSTAWRNFQRNIHGRVSSLEAWSKYVLQSMIDKKTSALLTKTIEDYIKERGDQFDKMHGGSEADFSVSLALAKDVDDSTKDAMQAARRKKKTEWMTDGEGAKGLNDNLGKGGKKRNDLKFLIPRMNTLEQIISLWQMKQVNSMGMRQELMRQLHLPESYLELPEAMDQAREAAVNPMPEAQPDEDEDGEGGSKKKKAKK